MIFSGPPCPIRVLCDNQAQDVGQFLQEEQGFKIITQSLKKEKKQRPCRRINWIRSCAEYQCRAFVRGELRDPLPLFLKLGWSEKRNEEKVKEIVKKNRHRKYSKKLSKKSSNLKEPTSSNTKVTNSLDGEKTGMNLGSQKLRSSASGRRV